jgi:hypothetical protein
MSKYKICFIYYLVRGCSKHKSVDISLIQLFQLSAYMLVLILVFWETSILEMMMPESTCNPEMSLFLYYSVNIHLNSSKCMLIILLKNLKHINSYQFFSNWYKVKNIPIKFFVCLDIHFYRI